METESDVAYTKGVVQSASFDLGDVVVVPTILIHKKRVVV